MSLIAYARVSTDEQTTVPGSCNTFRQAPNALLFWWSAPAVPDRVLDQQ